MSKVAKAGTSRLACLFFLAVSVPGSAGIAQQASQVTPKPQPLTLAEAWARAEAKSDQLIVAGAREEQARGSALESGSLRRPRLAAFTSYDRTLRSEFEGITGLGLSAADVAQAIRPAFAGLDAGDWVDPDGETRDVMVRLTDDARRGATSLAQLPLIVVGASGAVQPVPLGQVAAISEGAGPAQIDHLDRDRLITVQANVDGRPLGDVIEAIDARVATITLPAGYRITQGGDAADQAEVFGRIFSALGIAVLLMYLVLVMRFGSFLDPFAILLSLPLSLIGVVGGLLVTGDSLNLLSLIGVILLMGIVAKNAILLVDFAKHRRAQGATLRVALIEAGRVRLRPILMTTFALVAGMVPVAIGGGEGGDFYAPLGRAVIGGTLTSTLLTLLVVPTFYEVLEETKERARGWMVSIRRRASLSHTASLEAGD